MPHSFSIYLIDFRSFSRTYHKIKRFGVELYWNQIMLNFRKWMNEWRTKYEARTLSASDHKIEARGNKPQSPLMTITTTVTVATTTSTSTSTTTTALSHSHPLTSFPSPLRPSRTSMQNVNGTLKTLCCIHYMYSVIRYISSHKCLLAPIFRLKRENLLISTKHVYSG